jgi:hypothetical protein
MKLNKILLTIATLIHRGIRVIYENLYHFGCKFIALKGSLTMGFKKHTVNR